jgi:NDP-sugar pyrophosphorylase family protein
MVYNLLVKDGLKVSIYEIQHMQQWGTPGELEEYISWSDYFALLCQKHKEGKSFDAIKLIPMAGKGQRFQDAGYADPKPLLDISGRPMAVQAAGALPKCDRNIFICLQEHLNNYPLREELKKVYPNAKIVGLDQVTEGQACTCELGLEGENPDKPLFIGACDNSMILDENKLCEEMKKSDVLAFSFRNNPASEKKPESYGWLKTDADNNVTAVSVKVPISDNPKNDHAIVGAFYFKSVRVFLECCRYLYENNIRVNNEFYVDSCVEAAIKLGYKARAFEVEKYICWGTPDDYKTFIAYQSLFHKLDYHPYSLEKDFMVNKDKIADLDKQFRDFSQRYR